MKKISCFIVEDEVVSRSLLSYLISQQPELSLTGEFGNIDNTLVAYQKSSVELIFLDIHLGEVSGLDLAKLIGDETAIVFTTASRDYAPEAFNLNAVDYLVKPISAVRLEQAVEKAKKIITAKRIAKDESEVLYIKDSKGMVQINISQVLFVEALGDYLKLHTAEKFYTMLSTMKTMEEKLKPFGFIRVHRSFLVAAKHIRGMEGSLVLVGNQKIKVSENNKQELISLLNAKRI